MFEKRKLGPFVNCGVTVQVRGEERVAEEQRRSCS
jgi:hypothetical protein